MFTLEGECNKLAREIRANIFGGTKDGIRLPACSAVLVSSPDTPKFRIINVRFRRKQLVIEVRRLDTGKWVPLPGGYDIEYQR